MVETPKRRGLGRGLATLMDDIRAEGTPAQTTAPLEAIRPNPEQPRKSFNEGDLDSLVSSIRERGILQPLIVRRDPQRPDGWQIVAGERRWRAAQRAGLQEAPIIVKDYDDGQVLEIAIVENVQRADLNPLEEASGYAQLIERFGHTQEALASVMGRSRSHIANMMRLLQLPAEVQSLVRDGALSAGHARALITAPDPARLARDVVDRGLSVREAERLAKTPERPATRPAPPRREDPDTRALEADLSAALGLKVSIRQTGPGGELRIVYGDLEQLDGLCRLLGG